ncbi:MAG TPA: xanthine dehydrogenase family protein molybdopterin-binding subunit [Acidimicrobiales bacterium]|nr:xanthine dehydrogenase family protein molybdopterin-binding subunit [Acidimicrobiales bacterium]
MPLFGTPVTRQEDARLLTGGACYVGDVGLPGFAHVAYVTSPAAHAVIRRVDTAEASRMPGVLGVFGADDIDVGPYPPVSPDFPPAMARPLLATGRVRFVGEAIVAVVADSAEAAADAADAVVVDLEPLPVVVDAESAASGEVLLFPEAGSNVVAEAAGGSDEVDLDGCEVVVRATFHSSRIAPCPIEPRVGACSWGDDGRLTHWSSCQGAHPVRALLGKVHGLAPEQVRVIAPDVGGSFGAKARPYPEEVLLPWLGRRVGRPVRWVPPRSQDMVGLGHSRVQVQHVELGGRRDGTLEVLRVRVLADAGAYPLAGPLLARNTGALSPGAYRIPSARWEATAVVTNTTPTTAYRGAGRPEAAAVIERAVDLFAAEVGMDPVEVRRRNFIRPDEFPYRSATGLTYDSGDYGRVLDAALTAADYDGLRAEQSRRRGGGDPVALGVGVSTFVDRTAGVPGSEYGAVEVRSDGGMLVRTGSTPYGQGHVTSWAMLVSDRTGVPLEMIEVVYGDTDAVPRGSITGGSRSVQRAGSAVAEAADALVERARQAAAELLEADPADIVLDTDAGGRFHVAGTPARAVGWADLAARAGEADEALKCETDVGGDPTFPFGAYVAVVEVDTDTGRVGLRRLVTVDDAGRILNPLLAEGQVHGGAAQGVAQALTEEFVYDADGNPRTANLADYGIPTAADLPRIESSLIETPSPHNVLGAKGIAESGTIGAPPAVQNAVVDALSHLGVRHVDLPCTAERVWRAINRAGGTGGGSR